MNAFYWAVAMTAVSVVIALLAILHGRKSSRVIGLRDAVVRNSKIGFAVIDQAGTVQDANSIFCELVGSRPDEISNKGVLSATGIVSAKLAEEVVDRAVASNSPVCNQLDFTVNGEDRSFEFTVCQVDASNANQLVAILRDVSANRIDAEKRQEAEEKVTRLQRRVLDVVSQEQRRIGQDLHDGIGQEITGLNMMTDTLVEQLARAERPEVETARRVLERLRSTAEQIREISRGLVSFETDNLGLPGALKNLAKTFNESGRVQCSYSGPNDLEVANNSMATELFRIAQEAITNAIKHAQATEVSITLQQLNGEITLRVTDNGVGMDETNPAETGSGLRIMRHRASIAGGEFTILASDDGGTVIHCKIGSP